MMDNDNRQIDNPSPELINYFESLGLKSTTELVICNDGFQLKILAGPGFESSPVTPIGPWTHFQVEDTSRSDIQLTPYMGMLYSYDHDIIKYFQVPKQVLIDVVNSHGGIHSIKYRKGKPVALKTFLLLNDLFPPKDESKREKATFKMVESQYKKTNLKWGE